MFPIIVSDLNDYYAKQGRVYRAEIGVTGLAASGTFLAGVTTGSTPLRILQRAYSSSGNILTIELFEAAFTGGGATGLRVLNRNFNQPINPPATFLTNVTATPGAPLTAVTLRAATTTGSASLSVQSDDNVLVLKPNTQYVIRFTNGASSAADIGAAIDFRSVQPEE